MGRKQFGKIRKVLIAHHNSDIGNREVCGMEQMYCLTDSGLLNVFCQPYAGLFAEGTGQGRGVFAELFRQIVQRQFLLRMQLNIVNNILCKTGITGVGIIFHQKTVLVANLSRLFF